MAGDYKSSIEAVSAAFLEVPDAGRAKRAAERWPLLAAVQRVASTRRQTASASAAAARPSAHSGAWWEE